ncbi:MAG TPA: DNA primase [Alphaproteobacteria bacterium]
MAIDKQFLNELRIRLPLSALIGARVKLTRAGREYKACCPFHEEKSPSFYVNDEKGFYHCFGCGAHGDVVGFRMRYENISFREAVEALARDAGLPIPSYTPVDTEQVEHHQKLLRAMEMATLWFEQQLRAPQNKFALDYITQRGLKPETISGFRLGYAPNDWDSLRDAMLKQNVELNHLVEIGLLKQSEQKEKQPYSFFRGRLMFPVTDRQGRTIAFGGRHLDAAFKSSDFNSNTDYKPPKYINSQEHSLFHKGAQLYSLSRARVLAKDQPLVIVEGYMDVIALHQAGFGAAVAPLGTALTENQIMLAWQVAAAGSHIPLLCFDGDKAGLAAAYRALDRVLPHLTAEKQLKFVFLPSGEDPDSLARSKGKEGLAQVLNQSETVFNVLWQRALAQTGSDSPEAQARLQNQIEGDIRLIADKALQAAYGRELKDRLYQLRRAGQQTGNVRNFPSHGRSTRGPAQPKVVLTSPVNTGKTETQVNILLATLINHPWLISQQRENLASLPVPEASENASLLHGLQYAILDWPGPGEKDAQEPREMLLEYLSNQGFDTIVKDLLRERTYLHAGFARPQAEPDTVVQGWQDIWDMIQRDQVRQDEQMMRRQLAKDFSVQDAERLMALRQQQLQSDNDAD